MWFVLCLLMRRSFFFQERYDTLKDHALLLSFLVASAYGAIDEVHQQYVPDRTPDAYDAVADSVGALFYVVIFRIANRRKVAVPSSEEI